MQELGDDILVVDLDGTMCGYGTRENDYLDAYPTKLIDALQQAKRNGHKIVVHTARGMKRSGGDFPTIALQVYTELTNWFRQFGLWHLPDSLNVQKPYGAAYIDDKAVPASVGHLIQQLGDADKLVTLLNSGEVVEFIEAKWHEIQNS